MNPRLPEGIALVTIDALSVLCLRMEAEGQEEIHHRIKERIPQVKDVLAGSPICRLLGFAGDGEPLQVEIAFPTHQPVARNGFETKDSPEMRVFSICHVGPLTRSPEGMRFQDTWQRMAEFIVNGEILAGDDPIRYVYHRGPWSEGAEPAAYVTEIQVAYHLPVWLGALEDGTKRIAGNRSAARVMEGSDGLADSIDAARAAAWVRGAVMTLNEEVREECDRARILNGCAHHYPELTRERLQGLRDESGGLRDLVDRINEKDMLAGKYWIDESGDVPLLLVERRPARVDAFEAASTPAEKRYEACFCPLVRNAIRQGTSVPRTFCNCSGGWYVQEWEILLERRPRVDLIRTMLEGEDSCVFAVHLRAEELA